MLIMSSTARNNRKLHGTGKLKQPIGVNEQGTGKLAGKGWYDGRKDL